MLPADLSKLLASRRIIRIVCDNPLRPPSDTAYTELVVSVSPSTHGYYVRQLGSSQTKFRNMQVSRRRRQYESIADGTCKLMGTLVNHVDLLSLNNRTFDPSSFDIDATIMDCFDKRMGNQSRRSDWGTDSFSTIHSHTPTKKVEVFDRWSESSHFSDTPQSHQMKASSRWIACQGMLARRLPPRMPSRAYP